MGISILHFNITNEYIEEKSYHDDVLPLHHMTAYHIKTKAKWLYIIHIMTCFLCMTPWVFKVNLTYLLPSISNSFFLSSGLWRMTHKEGLPQVGLIWKGTDGLLYPAVVTIKNHGILKWQRKWSWLCCSGFMLFDPVDLPVVDSLKFNVCIN